MDVCNYVYCVCASACVYVLEVYGCIYQRLFRVYCCHCQRCVCKHVIIIIGTVIDLELKLSNAVVSEGMKIRKRAFIFISLQTNRRTDKHTKHTDDKTNIQQQKTSVHAYTDAPQTSDTDDKDIAPEMNPGDSDSSYSFFG